MEIGHAPPTVARRRIKLFMKSGYVEWNRGLIAPLGKNCRDPASSIGKHDGIVSD
jgi:hypothetical protein